MKKNIFLILSLLITTSVFSQAKLEFIYDETGNRITRKVPTVGMSTCSADINPETFTENILEYDISIQPNPTKGILRILEVSHWTLKFYFHFII